LEANQAYLDVFGFTKEEAQDLDILQIYPEVAAENRQRFQEAIEKHGSVKDYEVKLKTKDGRLIDCLSTSTLKRAPDGTIVGYQGIVRDITEYKQLQNELIQAQKMEGIGALAGGLSHDFNNILTVIHGYAELLIADHDYGDPRLNDLYKIVEAAKTGSELVRSLLAFSRKSEIQQRPMNINKQVEQIRQLLSRTIPKMINIETVLSAAPATINADPGQVGQVLMNLAINAKDAMPDGGTLTMETRNIIVDDEYCRTHVGLKPGAYVLLTVSDTGCGMDEDTLAHIFEPFFTTKEVGVGAGLGLAMVYGIVKQHGGEIMCSSELGSGTTLSVYLPALDQNEAGPEATAVKGLPVGGKETILLVDDEASIRSLGIKILSKAGYTVLSAPDGRAALDTYEQRGANISLVILDLMMPEMGGKQCLERLVEMDPRARVIISSGYSMDEQTKEVVESGARGFVRKPFQLEQMLHAVREVLDGSERDIISA
jgi:two-component system cell cycle sensor histidine kinase/response regulator CckA